MPTKVEPAAGEPFSVTRVPSGKEAVHVVGQLIPAGLLVTVPEPLPVMLTVKATSSAAAWDSVPSPIGDSESAAETNPCGEILPVPSTS
jgi:hypothetical protein